MLVQSFVDASCRQQLTDVIAEMATMRERWQTDVHQVEELGLLAGNMFARLVASLNMPTATI